MQKITQLPPDIVKRIAAGEVIERPFLAIKELIENAIDSKATVIDITIEDAGLKKIKVTDNGEGMSKEDLAICFLPHTTSKLVSGDIFGITTLGFRGEALSALSAVSDMTIISRTEEEAGGWSVTVRNGKMESLEPIGTPVGTMISIDHLFTNVPARKKFLKSRQTEFRFITELVTKFALSYPSTHFLLHHNGKTILDLPKRDSPIERLKILLGISMVDQLIPLSFEDGYIKIEGFIGLPQIATKNTTRQYLFVNNRMVTDRVISLAVKEAYGSLLSSSTTPVFLLYLTVPVEFVDVNIHPRKEQIGFSTPKIVFDGVKMAVTETLQKNNLTFHLSHFSTDSVRSGETTSQSALLLREKLVARNTLKERNKAYLQIAQTYIAVSTSDSLLLIDQHAAHERILFERFLTAFQEKKQQKKIIQLSKPYSYSFSLSEKLLLEEYQTIFAKLGFDIDHFHGETVLIRAIPDVFSGRNIEKILRDMLSDLTLKESISGVDEASKRMLAYLSCRSAVMAGEVLTTQEMEKLVGELQETANNATCPHGRPTVVTITPEELRATFKR